MTPQAFWPAHRGYAAYTFGPRVNDAVCTFGPHVNDAACTFGPRVNDAAPRSGTNCHEVKLVPVMSGYTQTRIIDQRAPHAWNQSRDNAQNDMGNAKRFAQRCLRISRRAHSARSNAATTNLTRAKTD